MTQEDKQLLLTDLSARLPYGVKCTTVVGSPARKLVRIVTDFTFSVYLINDEYMPSGYPIEEVKPYLRPMSSMTEEEKEYMEELSNFKCTLGYATQKVEFCLKKHLDFRGLIEKGLALEAPEGMYNLNKE